MEFGEGERPVVLPREQFTVEDAVFGQVEGGAGEVGELRGDAVEVARVEFDAVAGFVELAADAVVFFFEPDGGGKAGEDGVGGGLGAGEHELDGLENPELNRGERIGKSGTGNGAYVAAEHVGLADEFDRLAGSGGEGFFDETVFEADAEIAQEQLDQKFCFDGREGTEAGLEQTEFRGGRAGGGEGGEEFTGGDEGKGRGGGAAFQRGLGGIAGVGEALVSRAIVGFVETGERVESALDERPAEIERERGALGEGARGEVKGG